MHCRKQAYVRSSRRKARLGCGSASYAGAPHEHGEEGDPVEVKGEVVWPCEGEEPEGLGLVFAVNGVAKLWDSVVLKSMRDLLLVGVLALQSSHNTTLGGVGRIVVKVGHS